MLEVLSVANVPHETIRDLLDTRRISFPDQNINWNSVPDKLAEPFRSWEEHYATGETFKLICSSVSGRVNAIGLSQWRTKVMSQITLIRDGHRSRKADLANFRSTLVYYEDKYHKLKEATSMLELALWKAKIVEQKSINHKQEKGRSQEMMTMDESKYRSQCRISCGADNVIENMLPFPLPVRET